MTQSIVLIGLGALWVLFFSLEGYFRYDRSVRILCAWVSFVSGLIALLVTILMVIDIIRSESYRSLMYIGGVAVALIFFATVVRVILGEPGS
jgi:uncharacterized membrane protein YdcZ (DUF606 family)